MIIKKEIIYPIFLECTQFIEDRFWENVFEELAYGNSPYGTYISKDSLCCNYKDKEFIYKIEEKDPQKVYNDVYQLLNKKFGLLSQQDKINKKIDFQKIEEKIKDCRKDWANIRKKNIKELLIENYVIKMKNKYSLTVKQAKYLLSAIYISMVFKIINVKNIHYNNGVIEKIEGINFEKNKIILLKDIYDIKMNFNNIIIYDKNLLSDTWTKYIENLRKLKDSV